MAGREDAVVSGGTLRELIERAGGNLDSGDDKRKKEERWNISCLVFCFCIAFMVCIESGSIAYLDYLIMRNEKSLVCINQYF